MPELLCSGSRTRTDGLWVMSPTSYQLLHPAMYLLIIYRRFLELRFADFISAKRLQI
jgi:hypothetical protein